MPEGISERAGCAVSEGTFPGCVVGVIRSSGERTIMPFGRATYDRSSPEVREDTIYDLASVTKSIPLASLSAMFAMEGKLHLSDKVVDYIPELQNDFGATIEDLLRYRVRGPRMSELDFPTFEQIRTHMLEAGFDAPPGESEYSNLPAFLLGIVLERVGGRILPVLANKYFFEPLKMHETTYFPHDVSRVAPTELGDDGEIRGIVHDESARMFAAKRRTVGHAGLFSTAPDLLNFLESLLQGKFKPVVEFARQGLGWQLEGNFLGSGRGPTSAKKEGLALDRFGKTGFTGTSVALDMEKGIGLVILSNRTYPKRPADSSAINSFRADIADLMFNS
jgi:beta-N-acetylhexosaminidase